MPSSPASPHGRRPRALRQDMHLHQSVGPAGDPVIEPVEGESISLSPSGSIDRVKITNDRWYHCRCNANQWRPGGGCGEPGCHNISCERCFKRCHECYKPLCLEHASHAEVNGQQVTYCSRCLAALRQKRFLHTAAKLLLSPFLDFGGGPAK